MSQQPTAPDGITRRDFVQGAAAGSVAAAMIGALPTDARAVAGMPEPNGYYPALRTGMRGSHPGSFEVAHALRDGVAVGQAMAGAPFESHDLIVVGGGISGLAAATFYRDRHPSARILILENHDDFGGHAKRNEFHVGGKTLIMQGGTLGIDSPTPYSPVADGLLRRVGIDVPRLNKTYGEERAPAYKRLGLVPAVFLDRANFGRDTLHKRPRGTPLATALAGGPMTPAALAQIDALESGTFDPLGTMPADQRKDALSRMSYRNYLMQHGRLGDQAVRLYQDIPLGWWCVGADAISALDAWGARFPGFKGVGLTPGGTPAMGYTPRGFANTGGSYGFHFPDGNATIARLLVSGLVPGFAPDDLSPVESILAPLDYRALDREGSAVRLRLSSTVLRVANRAGGADGSGGADVVYANAEGVHKGAGTVRKVAARHVIMACWNTVIPYLIPDLPAAQAAGLHELVKEPLCYISVALTNWRAFAKAGVSAIQCPGMFYQSISLDRTLEIGGLTASATPDDPVVLHATHIPHVPGLPEHDQSRAGRAALLATEFATFERELIDLLNRTLGAYGFVAGRDIAEITVNRWPHGYSPEYNALWDARRDDEPDAPHLLGRARFGAITIANSDSGRAAYTDSAIDQAFRAVNELPA